VLKFTLIFALGESWIRAFSLKVVISHWPLNKLIFILNVQYLIFRFIFYLQPWATNGNRQVPLQNVDQLYGMSCWEKELKKKLLSSIDVIEKREPFCFTNNCTEISLHKLKLYLFQCCWSLCLLIKSLYIVCHKFRSLMRDDYISQSWFWTFLNWASFLGAAWSIDKVGSSQKSNHHKQI